MEDHKEKGEKNKFSQALEWYKAANSTIKTLVTAGIAVGVFIICFGVISIVNSAVSYFTPQQAKLTIQVESVISKVEESAQLNAVEYDYNGVAEVKNKKGDKTKYYVSYKGKVTAGFNFNEVTVEADEENPKKIIVKVPDITISDASVDYDSLDFIFIDKKADTETIRVEGYQVASKALDQASKEDKTIFKMGKETSISTLRALIDPLISQMDPETEVVFE